MIWTRIQCLGEPTEDGTHPPIEGDSKQKSTGLLNARRGAAQEAQGSRLIDRSEADVRTKEGWRRRVKGELD